MFKAGIRLSKIVSRRIDLLWVLGRLKDINVTSIISSRVLHLQLGNSSLPKCILTYQDKGIRELGN